MNSPLNILEVIKPMIEGKVFCDLGCGDGSFLKEAEKYCKKAVGIQWPNENVNEVLAGKVSGDEYQQCVDKGLNVIRGNVLNGEWPDADVYYWFVYYHDLPVVLKKHKKGILIIAGTPAKFEHYPREVNEGIILDIPTKNHEEPIWRIAILQKL